MKVSPLAELKNLRNSGDVQDTEAQALLKQRITDVKAENSQARADRKQYKKSDNDYLSVDELNYNHNPNNYDAKIENTSNRMSKVDKKLGKEDLTDEKRQFLMDKKS